MPVIYAASGNCHVYVDASADLDAALRIVVNAKTQRPGVCNAAETLLVHADVAARSCPRRVAALRERASSCAPTSARGRSLDGADRRHRRGLRRGVPRADPRRQGRRLVRGGDRARQPLRLRPLRGDRHRQRRRRRGRSSSASTRPACTSTPRRASPTAASSGWAPRSATRPRSCTRAARSACASCARSSTWSRATARSGP